MKQLLISLIGLLLVACCAFGFEEHWDDGDWINNPTWYEYDNYGNFAINTNWGYISTPCLEGWSGNIGTDYTALYTSLDCGESFMADFWVHKRTFDFSIFQIGFSEGPYNYQNRGFIVRINHNNMNGLWYLMIYDVNGVLLFQQQIQYDNNRWTNLHLNRESNNIWAVIWDYNGPYETTADVMDSFESFDDPHLWITPVGYYSNTGGFYLDDIMITPEPGQISGSITPPYEGVTIDLLNPESNEIIETALTDGNGEYTFSDLDPGDYLVCSIEPLGFSVDQSDVLVELVAGETETVNFELTLLATINDVRSKGYWKHQVNANLSNKGNPDYSTAELLAFSQDIFDHFYMNALNPIQVEGVTFVDNPASALSMEDLQYMLAINQGGSTMYERACQQYLALLLNVVSDKLGQYMQASDDGATVSQAIIYIDELLGDDDELAKDIAETLNQGQTVGAGVIPLTTPNVIFGNDGRAVVMVPREFVMHAYPNPFNPTTTLSFELPVAMNVNLSVFDITGRLVSELVNGFHTEGSYEVVFDGYQSASGIYIYSFKAGEFSETGKLVLVK